MNIYDISQKAGVSIATVSRVINGNTNVSEKTRQKILQIMEDTGYTPNAFARGLGMGTMQTIGILCADCSDSYLASAIYYFERELRSYNYDVILCCTGYELENKEKYLNLLLSKHVDAIILAGSNFIETVGDIELLSSPQLRQYNQHIISAAAEVPVIILNGYLDTPGVYCTLSDDRHAIYQVTKQLLENQVSDIFYLSRSDSYSGLKKKDGFQKAFQDMNINLPSENIISFNGNVNETKEMLMDVLNQKSVHAILASDDELAIGALKFAKEKGYRIPEDFSIVGYNNSKLSLCCDPELTTIDNKLDFVCSSAINTLMRVLDGCDVPHKTLLSSEVIERGTTNISFGSL